MTAKINPFCKSLTIFKNSVATKLAHRIVAKSKIDRIQLIVTTNLHLLSMDLQISKRKKHVKVHIFSSNFFSKFNQANE